MPSPRAEHRLSGFPEKLALPGYVGRGQYWDPEVAVPKVAFRRLSCRGVFRALGSAALMWGYEHNCLPSPWLPAWQSPLSGPGGCPWRGIFVADLSPPCPVRSQDWILQAHTAGKTELFFLFLVTHLPSQPSECLWPRTAELGDAETAPGTALPGRNLPGSQTLPSLPRQCLGRACAEPSVHGRSKLSLSLPGPRR